ncbi:MAG: HAMP domain-containing sensor histidine kinase [Candidatus Dojkabacteria bacterium]|nr:HAMP domain-containing sensor histidine kinase [Candidatus Dojkabacteria bacterium]
MITLILVIGWPVLIVMSYLIIKKGLNYYRKLKETVVGKLMIPTIFGWLFGMYALGTVATAYMLSQPWYFFVIPSFAAFLVAIIIVYRAIGKWEKEATELRDFYKNLEKLVRERTQELEEAHKKALVHEKEIQKLKDQFVFIAAHELKTPVTAIKWGIDMAIEEGKLDKETTEYLKNVQHSNERLITLVEDLLNVARIEAGTIKMDIQNLNLEEVVRETMKEMESVFKEKKVTASSNYNAAKQVTGDPNRIKQVLINFLSNAAKYNRDNGNITLEAVNDGDFVKVSVTDTGIGIKKEAMKKLFTKFGRIEDDKTKDVEGTGLGLYVTKQIVEKMGGEVLAESEYGKGSTFSFTVPIVMKTSEEVVD